MSSPLNNAPATSLLTWVAPGFPAAVLSRPPSVAGSMSDTLSDREVVFVPVMPIMVTPEMLERGLSSPVPRSPRLSISERQSPSLTAIGVQNAANRVGTMIDVTAASIDTVGTAVETVVDHTRMAIEAIRNRPWYQRLSAWLDNLPCCASDSATPDTDPQRGSRNGTRPDGARPG
ncbi:hypothetical protein ACUSIJ_07365 [Pseudochelatococcus sp. B33]